MGGSANIRAATRVNAEQASKFRNGWELPDRRQRDHRPTRPAGPRDPLVDTASHWTRRVYGHLGRLTQTTHPDNSTDTVSYSGYV